MVESNGNPYAIGVVGGRLVRQPGNLAEAIATAEALAAQGYNFSLGVAQVNRANFAAYGLDTYQQAFATCDNLTAGSRILADCLARMRGAWDKALSCYYSGDPVTGLREGYVQKVFASMDAAGSSELAPAYPPIPVIPAGSRSRSPARSRGTSAARIGARRRIADRTLPVRAGGLGTELALENDAGDPSPPGNRSERNTKLQPAQGATRPATAAVMNAAPPAPASSAPDASIALSGSTPATQTDLSSSRPAAVAVRAPAVTAPGAVPPPGPFVPRVSGVAEGVRASSTGMPDDAGKTVASPPKPRSSEADDAFVF